MVIFNYLYKTVLFFIIAIYITGCFSGGGSSTATVNVVDNKITIKGNIKVKDSNSLIDTKISVINHDNGTLIKQLDAEDGAYSIQVPSKSEDQVVRLKVVYTPQDAPEQTGTLVLRIPKESKTVDAQDIVLPNFQAATLQNDGSGTGTFSSNDAEPIIVTNMPSNVVSVWAEHFNPDTETESFPGEFFDSDDDALNSSGFLWVAALDSAGNEVTDFSSSPVVIRFPINRDQWLDLVDIEPGNGQVDIPMYSFNEDSGEWDRENAAAGVLVDSANILLTEAQGQEVRNGTFASPVFVRFSASHFSWWNVDYAFKRDIWGKNTAGDAFDYGDAPLSEGYPEIKHQFDPNSNQLIWLGHWISTEKEQNDTDDYDDGMICKSGHPLAFRVNALLGGTAYLNVLIDKNNDGKWGNNEWVVKNQQTTLPYRRGKLVETNITDWQDGQWLRVIVTAKTIDNPGFDGGASLGLGETEDYKQCSIPLTVDLRSAINNSQVISEFPAGIINCTNSASSDCREVVPYGERIKLIAKDKATSALIRGVVWQFSSNSVVTECEETMPSASCTFIAEGEDTGSEIFVSPKFPLANSFRVNTRSLSGDDGVIVSNDIPINCGSGNNQCEYTTYAAVPSPVTLTAQPNAGSLFSRWYYSSCTNENSNVCTISINTAGGANYYANAEFGYEYRNLDISLFGNGQGKVVGDGIDCRTQTENHTQDCTERFIPGNQNSVDLEAVPAEGSYLSKWSEPCDSTDNPNQCKFTISSDSQRVSATFLAEEHQLNISVTGAGKVFADGSRHYCDNSDDPGTVCAQTRYYGSTVTLTAVPDDNHQIASWEGCDPAAENDADTANANKNECIVTIDGTENIKATFEPLLHSLDLNIVGGGYIADANGAVVCDEDCNDLVYQQGTTLELTGKPFENNQFSKWIGCSNDNDPNDDQCTITIEGNESLTAEFVPILHRLNLSVSGAGKISVTNSLNETIDCSSDCSPSYQQAETVKLLATPDQYHEFNGWSGCVPPDATKPEECVVEITEATNVTANFSHTIHSINTTIVGSGKVEGANGGINCFADSNTANNDCSEDINAGVSVTLVATADEYHEFSGWQGCTPTADNPRVCTVLIDAVKQVVANFRPISRNLTIQFQPDDQGQIGGQVTDEDNGISCDNNCTISVNAGDNFRLKAKPNVHYKIKGWLGCDTNEGVSEDTCLISITDTDKTVVVGFELIKYPLTVTVTGSGNVVDQSQANQTPSSLISCGSNGNTCDENLLEGSSITLLASPDNNHKLTELTGCDNTVDLNSGLCEITMNGAENIVAKFEPIQKTLTVDTGGSGNGNVVDEGIAGNGQKIDHSNNDRSELLNQGDTITLIATADTHHQFTGWNGCETPHVVNGSNGEKCTVNIAASLASSITVTANFEPITNPLNIAITGSGNVTGYSGNIDCNSQCSEAIQEGDNVTLTANPATDYVFVSWTGCDEVDAANRECTINNMTSPKDVSVRFEPSTTRNLSINFAGAGSRYGKIKVESHSYECGSNCTLSFSAGETITLSANTGIEKGAFGSIGDGYFPRWVGCNGGNYFDRTCTITLNESKQISVYYNLGHMIKLSSIGGNRVVSDDGEFSCDLYSCQLVLPKSSTTIDPILEIDHESDTHVFGGWPNSRCDNSLTNHDRYRRCKIVRDSSANSTAITAAFASSRNVSINIEGTGSVGSYYYYGNSSTYGAVPASSIFSSSKGRLEEYNCTNDCTLKFPRTDAIQISPKALAGHRFVSWQGCYTVILGNVCTLTASGSTANVTATFEPITHDLTVSVNGNGIVTSDGSSAINCGTECTTTLNHGESITLEANPQSGFKLDSWDNCPNVTDGKCEVTFTDQELDKTVTANFVPVTINLSVNIIGEGSVIEVVEPGNPLRIDCGTDCTETMQQFDSIQLVARSADGYTFDKWSGCDFTTQNNACVVYAGSTDRTVSAEFKVNTYQLDIQFDGSYGGSGKVRITPPGVDCIPTTLSQCSQQYQGIQEITMEAIPDEGSNFDNSSWGLSIPECAGKNPCTISSDKSTFVQVGFSPVSTTD
jgi:hypothetical protein